MNAPPTGAIPPPSDPEVDEAALLAAARGALDAAYGPYSGVRVGAAVQDEDGRVFAGCNVENASYGLTVCAERNAVARAVGEGARRLVAVAIATSRPDRLPPCGACRQVLREFSEELLVVSEGSDGGTSRWRLSELLPQAFRADDLA
ncbi:MAG: cytidine deaminase [Planctomycetes bacterium]|nr:cytidine deaminase [Planctomycetota bacterium]